MGGLGQAQYDWAIECQVSFTAQKCGLIYPRSTTKPCCREKIMFLNTILPVSAQSKKKAENKKKILDFLRKNEKVVNNDIEKLLDVSDSTTTRYLDELEKENKIVQIGTTGNAVYYILK
jgi:predicted HTH transcriptional regulator